MAAKPSIKDLVAVMPAATTRVHFNLIDDTVRDRARGRPRSVREDLQVARHYWLLRSLGVPEPQAVKAVCEAWVVKTETVRAARRTYRSGARERGNLVDKLEELKAEALRYRREDLQLPS